MNPWMYAETYFKFFSLVVGFTLVLFFLWPTTKWAILYILQFLGAYLFVGMVLASFKKIQLKPNTP